uniref:Uncharacterized protein n=1 Tax=Vespula pensylvanica TaxID=30213 RepID=A0A834UCZ4_VESPE|nr:hypothetical protein H0235_004535 [Vespula pensylvanica]
MSPLMGIFYARLRAVTIYNPDPMPYLRAPITLFKPLVPPILNAPYDYELQNITEGKVDVHVVEGNHYTMLSATEISMAINGELFECAGTIKKTFPEANNEEEVKNNISIPKIVSMMKTILGNYFLKFEQAHTLDSTSRTLLERTYEVTVDAGIIPEYIRKQHNTVARIREPEELSFINRIFTKFRANPLKSGCIKSNLGHIKPTNVDSSIAKINNVTQINYGRWANRNNCIVNFVRCERIFINSLDDTNADDLPVRFFKTSDALVANGLEMYKVVTINIPIIKSRTIEFVVNKVNTSTEKLDSPIVWDISDVLPLEEINVNAFTFPSKLGGEDIPKDVIILESYMTETSETELSNRNKSLDILILRELELRIVSEKHTSVEFRILSKKKKKIPENTMIIKVHSNDLTDRFINCLQKEHRGYIFRVLLIQELMTGNVWDSCTLQLLRSCEPKLTYHVIINQLIFSWIVPDSWNLEHAATVLCVYRIYIASPHITEKCRTVKVLLFMLALVELAKLRLT